MNKTSIQAWKQLPETTRLNLFEETGMELGIPAMAVEKDWWVVRTLELVFSSSIAKATVFKGGTSLSKAWGLIDRFSEDIDLALDRRFLGVEKPDSEMGTAQVAKLRRRSVKFIKDFFVPELAGLFKEAGLGVSLEVPELNPTDPLVIEVIYPSITQTNAYLVPKVLIEIGSRSLIEPYVYKNFRSFLGEKYNNFSFTDELISIPCVDPQRTFLEKIFLLHEEFQFPEERIKIYRKSRHMYDLEKLMDSSFGKLALKNQFLYSTIVRHRARFTPWGGIDYSKHAPRFIKLIPPVGLISEWQKDYSAMQRNMFKSPSISFDDVMKRMAILNERLHAISWDLD
ncbi:MAG: nucleotidyl transferase AbiEii/AbiGii toxin family protein [Bacteroidetes bacterium]|nr:nucleotidyl transferase AbiEii/AbiGii toxin family protein [Bacteroidota bacterium]